MIAISKTDLGKMTSILHFVSGEEPENYSWSSTGSLDVTIPEDGYYYVMVRSCLNYKSGVCNININDQIFCDSVTFYSSYVACTHSADTIYNIFTSNSTNDPMLWIIDSTFPMGKVVAFNDDYSGDGDFDWDVEARVKTKFDKNVSVVLVSSLSSNSSIEQTDLYMRCLNSDICPYFEDLKMDDAIQSAPASNEYRYVLLIDYICMTSGRTPCHT